MKNNYERLQQIANEGYELEFGTVLDKAFNNYKKIAGIAGLGFILLTIVIVALVFGIIGIAFGFANFNETMLNFDPTMFSGVSIVIYLLFVIVVSGIMASINAGFYKMAHLAHTNKDFGIGNLFDYFKTIHFKELFVATAIISLFTTGFTLLFEYIGYNFIGVIITYILSFFTFLVVPIIIFSDAKALDAIPLSIKLVLKNPFILLGLLIVSLIFAFLGLIGFCLGIFFTMPFMFSMIYIIYIEIMPIDEKSAIDEIGINELE
jgi:hypothetical protein